MKEKLNIFNVKNLIFENIKAEQELFDKYQNYFKEYKFLKSIGADDSLFSKLYFNFLRNIKKNKDDKLISKILKKDMKISADNKSLIYNINIIYKYNTSNNNNILYNNTSNNNNNILYNKYLINNIFINNNININNIMNIYTNLCLYKKEKKIFMTFWR